jgi:CRP-like cAMP-binding protein
VTGVAERYAAAAALLGEIASAEALRAEALLIAAKHRAWRDEVIRQAMTAGVPRARIAEVAGVTPAMLYRIMGRGSAPMA